MSRDLSVIIPAYNERGNLPCALSDVLVAMRRVGCDMIDRFEIIIVDDGSTDGTTRLAESLARQFDYIRVVHHRKNQGIRAAYESGLSLAQYSHVTWIPGSAEMAMESICDIIKAVGTADLVVPYHGTPERRKWYRRVLTWVSTNQLNWLLGYQLHYWQGTVVYPTELARRLPRTEPGMYCQAEMLAHALEEGLTYVEVPLAHVPRSYGKSVSVGWRRIWAAQKHILRLWWRLRVVPLWHVISYGVEEV